MIDEPVTTVEISKETAELLGAKTAEIDEPAPIHAAEMVVYAENSGDMVMAQTNLIRWATTKLAEVESEAKEIDENLAAAKKHKWRTVGLAAMATRAHRRVQYYGKIKLALEAGYVIVPSFPVDVFAVRVLKDPQRKSFSSRGGLNWHFEHRAEHLAAGEGKFVRPQPEASAIEYPSPTAKDPNHKEMSVSATDWADVDFPAMLARPRVMEATSRAMSDLIFDRLCASPGRSRPGLTRGGDPMVIGQIVMKQGYSQKVVSFVVSWFIDTRDL